MWGGALLSNVGTWMETVALGYYVADSTGKASWLAIVAAAGFLPGAIIGPVGSAMADRLRRRRVLAVGSTASGLIAAALALWVGTGNATPAGIAVVAFIAGCVSAFTFPSFQTTLPTLVPRDQLVAAVGLSNAQWNIGRVVGPALAAIAIALGGIQAALWCNAASYLAVVVAVVRVRFQQPVGERRPIFGALADGFRFARNSPAMRSMLVLMVATIAIASPFIAFVPQMATTVLGGGSNAMGLFFPFLDEPSVEMHGVEAAGHGVDTHQHAASLSKGRPGILHGNKTYLLQDADGQITEAHSISAGLDYPGIGPEHAWLNDVKRVTYVHATDTDALEAFQLCAKLEGILPALEPAHALAHVMRIAPGMPKDKLIVMNMCGRGDKDIFTVADALKVTL